MNPKNRVTIRMPVDLNKALTNKSEKMGISKNALILQALWKKVEGRNKNGRVNKN